MNNSMNQYELKNLEYNYIDRFQLQIPALTIKKGKSLGIVGSNGSGKTTLLKILALLLQPMSGEILFNGLKFNGLPNDKRKKITMLMQNPYLLKRTIYDNIAYGLKVQKSTHNLDVRINDILLLIGLEPDLYKNRKWYELSGGEAQRVALASRLILEPEVLILDEPISNIDYESANRIKDSINKIRNKYNPTIISTSHDLIWLNSVSDNIIKMHHGKIVGSGHDNIINGPWQRGEDNLWFKNLNNELKIFACKPPEINSDAILPSTDIIISTQKQKEISAQNNLPGKIVNMSMANTSGKIVADVHVDDMTFKCNVTDHAVKELKLHPGSDVWIIFKATSLQWQ